MLSLSHTGVNTSDEIGDTSGLIVALRIVPTRHEPGMVYARTLPRGEEDDGRRVHVAPDEQVTLEDFTVELEYLDELQEPTASGYVPLTPSLWSWLSIGRKTTPSSGICLLRHDVSIRPMNFSSLWNITAKRLTSWKALGRPSDRTCSLSSVRLRQQLSLLVGPLICPLKLLPDLG